MTTLLLTHPACLAHDMGPHHPECPARLGVILEALAAPDFAALERVEAPLAQREMLVRVHEAAYVDGLLAAVPERGIVELDPDTVLCAGSGAAVDAVIEGGAANAFCAVRPPGHHAESGAAMGFCLFNNVAVGALHAREAHGIDRIAVVDFDVHHGNGTQHMFEPDGGLFYASTHQWPLYPGTGARSERGMGNICNAPLPPGAGGAAFRAAMTDTVLPALDRFAPQLVMISAGFDAHRADPLASLELEEEDFAWATDRLLEVAARHAGGRLVSTLEGGYDLAALAASAAAHVRRLLAAG
ncbi:MAG: histone deacetylase family protein [Dongiaceae bacterium]